MNAARLERLAVALIYAGAITLPAAGARAQEAGEKDFDIDARVRMPMALMIITPAGKIANADSSQIISRADSMLLRSTDLQAKPYDDPGCKGNHTCYVETIRTDYTSRLRSFKREDDPDKYVGFSEVMRGLKAVTPAAPRFLVVISASRSQDGSDRMSAILIDTDDALLYIHEANAQGDRGNPAKEDALEDKILQYSAKATPPPVTVTQDDQVDAYIRELFEVDFRPELEKTKHWMPYGKVALTAPPGMAIDIDGINLGTTKAGVTTIGNVLPGERTIRLSHPDYLPSEGKVLVETGQSSPLTLEVARQPNELARTARKGVFWTGVALTAAGAVVTALAIDRAARADTSVVCVTNGAGCGGSSEFLKVGGTAPGDTIDIQADPNGGKFVPFAPLGYSMMGAGLSWSLGTLFLGDEDTLPLLELGIGVGVFVASMAISILADGTTACGNNGCNVVPE